MEIIKIPLGSFQTNCYIVHNNQSAAIIDPGFSSDTVIKILEDNNLQPEKIILTHGHGDHIGAVSDLKNKYNISVIAHKNEKEILNNSKLNLSEVMETGAIEIDADEYVVDGDIIEISDMEFKVLYTPGHTIGGMCLYIDKYLFSGDSIFQYSIGRTDFPTGDYDTLINSIKTKIYILPDETIILSGHGETTSVEFEKQYNQFVK